MEDDASITEKRKTKGKGIGKKTKTQDNQKVMKNNCGSKLNRNI